MPFRVLGDGIELFVRLTPKSSRDAIDGVDEDAAGRSFLKARVRAVPERGAANKALVALVAKSLNIPRKSIAVVSGQTWRLKTLRIAGEAAVLRDRAERLTRQG